MAGLTKTDDNNATVAELENNGLGCRKVSVLDNNNFASAIGDADDSDGQNLGPFQAAGFYDPHRKQSLKHHQNLPSFFSRLLNLNRSDRVDSFTSKLSINLISLICECSPLLFLPLSLLSRPLDKLTDKMKHQTN